MNKKFISSVTGASILLVIVAILSKGLGFIREMIFANYFGLSHEFDIYLIGAVLPMTINTIIIFLGQNYLIPAYNRVKEKEPSLIENFIRINFFIFILGGLLLTVILYFFSDSIVGLYLHGANADAVNTTIIVFRIFLISIPFFCAISVISAFHQIHFEFRYPAYGQVLSSIIMIILLIIFNDRFGIYIIPAGYVAGSFLRMVYLLTKSNIKFRVFKTDLSLKKYKSFIPRTLLIIILIESIGQLYLIVDRYFFDYVPTGGIAALNYAQLIFMLPVSILSIALSTAIFPKFSQFISRKLIGELENNFNEGLKINIALFIPIAFLFICYGDYIITIFFQRGKFTASDTLVTYHVLIFYSISLVFYAAYSINNKLLYGLGLTRKLLYITIFGILLKIILNFLFVGKFKQDGLALSSSISYLFFFLTSLTVIYTKVRFKNRKIFLTEIFFNLSNGIISFLIAYQISALFVKSNLSTFFNIILFLILYLSNIYFVKHSSYYIFMRVKDSLLSSKKNILVEE